MQQPSLKCCFVDLGSNQKRISSTELESLAHLSNSTQVQKSGKYLINTKATYTHWIDVVIQLGKDCTKASLEITMDNPSNAVRQDQAAAEIQDHFLTRQVARDANNNHAIPGPRVFPANCDINNVYIKRIFETHEVNKKYNSKFPVFIDPNNKNQYIPLSPSMNQQWAQALVSHSIFFLNSYRC
jgi:hypothetical protein